MFLLGWAWCLRNQRIVRVLFLPEEGWNLVEIVQAALNLVVSSILRFHLCLSSRLVVKFVEDQPCEIPIIQGDELILVFIKCLTKYPFDFEAVDQEIEDSCIFNSDLAVAIQFEIIQIHDFLNAFQIVFEQPLEVERLASLIDLFYLTAGIVLGGLVFLWLANMIIFFVPQLGHELASIVKVFVDQLAQQQDIVFIQCDRDVLDADVVRAIEALYWGVSDWEEVVSDGLVELLTNVELDELVIQLEVFIASLASLRLHCWEVFKDQEERVLALSGWKLKIGLFHLDLEDGFMIFALSWLLDIFALFSWPFLLPGLLYVRNLIFIWLLNHHNLKQAFQVDDEQQVRY